MVGPPSPCGSLHLFGLDDRRLDAVLSALLVALVAASRLAAFPASIWEQDEAYFAAAVVHLDPGGNAPHPPWFPLWIGLGSLVHLTGVEAARALQLVSLSASVWILFPLTSLWSKLLPRSLAPAAAVLFLAAPGPWLLSGRAFTGTAATALLAAALALWLRTDDSRSALVGGALVAGLAVGVRPQLLPAAAATALVAGWRAPGRRWLPVTVLAGVVAAWTLGLVAVTGGGGPLWKALTAHAAWHLSQLDEAARGFAESGLSRSLGGTVPATAWVVLLVLGMIRLIRSREPRELAPFLVGVLLPLTVVTFALSNPGHPRYAVPLLAFTGGLVVAGLESLLGRRTWLAVGGLAVLSAAVVVPQLAPYRSLSSPPVAALEAAISEARARAGVLVIDPTLHAFWLHRQAERPVPVAVLFDHDIAAAVRDPDSPPGWVFLLDATGDRARSLPTPRFLVSSAIPLISAVAQDRFLDVAVVTEVGDRRPGTTPTRNDPRSQGGQER